jgi:carbon storage regulator CsrA
MEVGSMLVLSRKAGEEIVLPDCGVTIGVIRVAGKRVRLGIKAPPEITVRRNELPQKERNPHASGDHLESLAERVVRRTGGKVDSLHVTTLSGRVVVHGSVGSLDDWQVVREAILDLLAAEESPGSGDLRIDYRIAVRPRRLSPRNSTERPPS